MDFILIVLAYVLIYAGADLKQDEDGKFYFIERKFLSMEWILHVFLITMGGILLTKLS